MAAALGQSRRDRPSPCTAAVNKGVGEQRGQLTAPLSPGRVDGGCIDKELRSVVIEDHGRSCSFLVHDGLGCHHRVPLGTGKVIGSSCPVKERRAGGPGWSTVPASRSLQHAAEDRIPAPASSSDCNRLPGLASPAVPEGNRYHQAPPQTDGARPSPFQAVLMGGSP